MPAGIHTGYVLVDASINFEWLPPVTVNLYKLAVIIHIKLKVDI